MIEYYLILFFVFLLGSVVGSFLNVLIHRLPLNQSIITPRSNCPGCKTFIPWYDNLPLISFMILKGRCRSCRTKIKWRYFLVELISGCAAVFIFPKSLILVDIGFAALYFMIFSILLVHFFIDLDHKLLLDKLNLALIIPILIIVVFTQPIFFWVYGGLVGFGAPYFVTWAFYKLRGQIGLGGGDIKLYGILGLLLGVKGIIFNIFFSSFLGSVIGLLLILTKKMNKNEALPFGPFIIIASVIQIFMPDLVAAVLSGLFA